MRRRLLLCVVALFLLPILFTKEVTAEKGNPIKIAIIDSGLDVSHPQLLHKKIHGYDFIAKKKKLVDFNGHGTHVTGIVYQVAPPDVVIYSYRVLDEEDGLSEEVDISRALKEALKEAIKKKVDVINLSLGKESTDEEIMRLIQCAVQKGITVVVAAGNSGPSPGSLYSFATLPDVISVGVCRKDGIVPVIRIEGVEKQMELLPLEDSPSFPDIGDFPIVYVGKGKRKADYRDVSGKIVLVKRSCQLSSRKQAKLAYNAGAAAVIVMNTKSGEWDGETGIRELEDECFIPTAAVTGKQGDLLKTRMAMGETFINFSSVHKSFLDYSSSRGPVIETGILKPDLVAPGINIRSYYPLALERTGYEEMSGTSQATAYVTGVVACLKQINPQWGPPEIKAALMGTASPLMNSIECIIPCTDQGAGLIDIEKALSVKSMAIPSSLSFETVHSSTEGVQTKELILKNESDGSMQYSFRVEYYPKHHGLRVEVPPVIEVSAKSEVSIIIKVLTDARLKTGGHTGAVWITGERDKIHVPFLVTKRE